MTAISAQTLDFFISQESARHQAFSHVWTKELDQVFADVANYYDRANHVASLGLWSWFRVGFVSTIDLRPHDRVLDVCSGTNALGIALLRNEPSIDVYAIDRSPEMMDVGMRKANGLGLQIKPAIGDVHRLPYPDNYFNVVTLQYASRHLCVVDVFSEIKRVLVPGGHFYHCDMLRPNNVFIENLYYWYLRACLTTTGWLFRSNPAALRCRKYFIDALKMFYSAEELAVLLEQLGFRSVSYKTILGGMVGFHKCTGD